jgi:hypothetical protein
MPGPPLHRWHRVQWQNPIAPASCTSNVIRPHRHAPYKVSLILTIIARSEGEALAQVSERQGTFPRTGAGEGTGEAELEPSEAEGPHLPPFVRERSDTNAHRRQGDRCDFTNGWN